LIRHYPCSLVLLLYFRSTLQRVVKARSRISSSHIECPHPCFAMKAMYDFFAGLP